MKIFAEYFVLKTKSAQNFFSKDIIIKGSALAFAIQVIGTGVKYIMQVLLARWMGAAEYGLFSYTYNWALLLAVVAGLGLSSSALRFIPEYIAQKSWTLLNGFIVRSNQIVIISGITIAMVGGFLLKQMNAQNSPLTILLGMMFIPLISLSTHQSQLLRGIKDIFFAFTPTRILQPLLSIFFIFLLWQTLGEVSNITALAAMALSILFVIVFQAFIMARLIPRQAKNVSPDFDNITWIKVSLPMLISAISSTFIVQIDIVLVGVFLPSAQVGIYAAAGKTATLVSFLLISVNAIVAPLIAELYAHKEYQKLRTLARTATRWMSIPVLVVTILLAFIGKYILSWFGPEFGQAYWPLMILAVGQLVNALTGPVGYLTELTGHQNYSARVYLVCAVISIILNVFLIPRFGILGASIGTSAALVLSNIWLYYFVYSNILKKEILTGDYE